MFTCYGAVGLVRESSVARTRASWHLIDLSVSVPHVTVYMASFPDDVVDGTAEVLRAGGCAGARFDAGRWTSSCDGGYVFLEVMTVPLIPKLHELWLWRLFHRFGGPSSRERVQRLAERDSRSSCQRFERYGSPRGSRATTTRT